MSPSVRHLLLVGGLALLAACTSPTPPTRFFQMYPVIEGRDSTTSPVRLLGIAPIIFPDYLDRPQIVTRRSDTQLSLADLDQWSAPLDVMFTNVLSENLRRHLGGAHVVAVPSQRPEQPSIELDLDVLRFDADATGKVVLLSRWQLVDPDGKVVTTRRTDLEETATAGDYAAIAGAMSRTVGRLADEIVAALPRAAGKRTARS